MEILYIIFGWVLGIFSPLIIKKISAKGEKDNLRKIIFNDLRDLKKRLSPLPFSVLPKYGKFDEKTFEWVRKNSDINFSEGVSEMLKKGIDLKTILKYINEIKSQKNTLSYFKKMHLFAIDSHLINFNLIDGPLVAKVLEVKFQTEAFNEDIDNFRENLKMTFQPGITDTNYEIISQQLQNISLIIAEKAMYIVDNINVILEDTARDTSF